MRFILFYVVLLSCFFMSGVRPANAFSVTGGYICNGATPQCWVCDGDCGISVAQSTCNSMGYGSSASVVGDYSLYDQCAPAVVNGSCGTANGGQFAPAPSSNLCGSGTASSVTLSGGNWVWTCAGSGGGSTSNCSAAAPSCWDGSVEACVDICGFGSPGGNVSGFQFSNGSIGWAGPSACVTHCGGAAAGFYPTTSVGSLSSCSTPPVVNGSCSATAGACTTGTVASDNGLTSCGTTRTWTCNGSGGGTNASCSYTNAACVVNGSCSATAGACTAGTAASDNGLTACGTTRTWSCNGSGGGTNASCSKANAACIVNGVCGAGSGTCSAGTVTSDNGLTACGTTRTWTCAGSGGGSNASCSYTNSVCAVNGACGSANGSSYTTAPSANLCLTGTASAVSGAGPWSWTCNGSGGGSNASCSANLVAPVACSAPKMIHGTCGTSNGQSFYTAPSSNLCSTGTASAVSPAAGPPSGWSWTCTGSSGGSTASCTALKKIDGVCGTSQGKASANAPTSNLCSVGSASVVTVGASSYSWTCSGTSGGVNATCSAPRTINGACGTADGFATTVAPAANLCAAGTASAVTGSGPWAWSCTGSNGGLTKACAAPITVAPTYGGACPS